MRSFVIDPGLNCTYLHQSASLWEHGLKQGWNRHWADGYAMNFVAPAKCWSIPFSYLQSANWNQTREIGTNILNRRFIFIGRSSSGYLHPEKCAWHLMNWHRILLVSFRLPHLKDCIPTEVNPNPNNSAKPILNIQRALNTEFPIHANSTHSCVNTI